MASLYINSLFTNIPLDKTINIYVDNNDNENPPNIPSMIFVICHQIIIFYNNNYYKQVDGVAMGPPLGPALANIFMCSFESKWL